jgi:hypothetical protein
VNQASSQQEAGGKPIMVILNKDQLSYQKKKYTYNDVHRCYQNVDIPKTISFEIF